MHFGVSGVEKARSRLFESNMESDGVARFLLQQNSPEHSVKNEGLRQFWIAEANIGQNVSNLGKNKIGVGVSFEESGYCREMIEKKQKKNN